MLAREKLTWYSLFWLEQIQSAFRYIYIYIPGPLKSTARVPFMASTTQSGPHIFLFAWAICAQCVSFALRIFVYAALCFMTRYDILVISKHIEAVLMGPSGDDAESEWSLVSDDDAEAKPLTPQRPKKQASCSGQPLPHTCPHVNTTRRGTNDKNFQIRCLDCKKLLVKVPKCVQRKTGSPGSK